MIYKTLNVHLKTFTYNRKINQDNKVILFLTGMRGSGKTSELSKIAEKLNNKDCFFCVTCNLDIGLDFNDMEYMDIFIFQLERLFEELETAKLSPNQKILASLQDWFGERVKEVNNVIKQEGGFEVEIGAASPMHIQFLKNCRQVES